MFHFTEGMTKKGANSVCSFVRNVILVERKDFKDVFLLSDGCTGQNRNWVVASVLSALAKEENISITQVFPVRGHSYCQCDRNFALYSRVAKKTETIETVDEYVSIIQGSKKTGKIPSLCRNVQFVTLKNTSKYVNPENYLYPRLWFCSMTKVEI